MAKLEIGTKLYSFQHLDNEDGYMYRLVEATVCSVTEMVIYPEGEIDPVSFPLSSEDWKEQHLRYSYELVDSMNFSEKIKPSYLSNGHNKKYCAVSSEIHIPENDYWMETASYPEWFLSIDEALDYEKQKFLNQCRENEKVRS